jgi:splicing factor 3A subunit 1
VWTDAYGGGGWQGPTTVAVAVPAQAAGEDKGVALHGQTETLTLPLTTTVAQLKELLQARVGLPAGRMNLKHAQLGLLKDHLSLAHYNLGRGSELQLLTRERGRKK